MKTQRERYLGILKNCAACMILVVAIIALVVLVSGCIDENNYSSAVDNSTANIVVCPNPNCPLHDPNTPDLERPIDIEVGDTTAGGTKTVYYLCQICGTQWKV